MSLQVGAKSSTSSLMRYLHKKQPIVVLVLLISYILLALAGWVRMVYAILSWNWLEYVGIWPGPWYQAITGGLWGLAGLAALIWLVPERRNAWLVGLGAALIFAITYWADRWLVSGLATGGDNFWFAGALTILGLTFALFVLLRHYRRKDMSSGEREIEVKFMVRDLVAVASRLQTLGARLSTPRVQETNLRFDTPKNDLQRKRHVLRLRQDVASVLTFKGPAEAGEAVSSRQEIEFQVSDFEAARHFLEALGYRVVIIYEKYRTTYDYKDCMVTLDEMPYGPFMEIEGPDEETIRTVAKDLGLDWEARCTLSYLALFDRLHQTQHINAHNLTFNELKGVTVMPQNLGLRYADQ